MRTLVKLYFYLLSRIWPALAAKHAGRLLFTPQLPASLPDMPSPDEVVCVSDDTCVMIWRGQGKTVLLMHGWSGAVEQFTHLLPRLLHLGCRVVAPVPKGHRYQGEGRSHPGYFIKAVNEVLTCQSLRVHAAIGHSMGGSALALHGVSHLQIARVVLIGAPAGLTGVLNRFGHFLGFNQRAQNALYALADSTVGVSHEAMDAATHLMKTAQRALVIHDKDDREVPFKDAEQYVMKHPDARLYSTEGFGHRRILQNDAVINEIIDFIR